MEKTHQIVCPPGIAEQMRRELKQLRLRDQVVFMEHPRAWWQFWTWPVFTVTAQEPTLAELDVLFKRLSKKAWKDQTWA